MSTDLLSVLVLVHSTWIDPFVSASSISAVYNTSTEPTVYLILVATEAV